MISDKCRQNVSPFATADIQQRTCATDKIPPAFYLLRRSVVDKIPPAFFIIPKRLLRLFPKSPQFASKHSAPQSRLCEPKLRF